MANLVRRVNNYQILIDTVKEDGFVIAGNNEAAHDLYLYCLENGYTSLVKGFVLTNRDEYDHFVPETIHGQGFVSLTDYLNQPISTNVYIPEAEYYVHDVILPQFENAEKKEFNIFYCPDFYKGASVHNHFGKYAKMLCDFNTVEDNTDQVDTVSIFDDNNQKYLYTLKTYKAVVPNEKIFSRKDGLKIQHEHELGEYKNFENANFDEDSEKECRVYMACSVHDLEIKDEYSAPCLIPVQAGAALSEEDLYELKDNTGDNISLRNRDYCEMSVAYWAWKNDTTSDYIGLCHYRRRFKTDISVINHLMNNDYDVITTLPKVIDGGLYEEFVGENGYIDQATWKMLGDALEKTDKAIHETWKNARNMHMLLPYNMSIMKRDVYNTYCKILFEVLETVDQNDTCKGIQRDNRYLGYVSEVFLPLFLSTYKDKYKKGYLPMKMLL